MSCVIDIYTRDPPPNGWYPVSGFSINTATSSNKGSLSAPYKQGVGVDVFIFSTVYWSTNLSTRTTSHLLYGAGAWS